MVEELEEEVLVKGVDFGLTVEPKLVAVKEPEMEDRVPVPEEEGKEEVLEGGGAMSNGVVWERTELTFPVGDAWREYPGPAGTTGRATEMLPSEVRTVFFNANVLWKSLLTK